LDSIAVVYLRKSGEASGNKGIRRRKMNNQLSITTLTLLLMLFASIITAQSRVFNIRRYGAPNGDITNVRSFSINDIDRKMTKYD
jgi:hypothetical protein